MGESRHDPPLIGYDGASNKLIIQLANADINKGFIYDFGTNSLVEHRNLINWFANNNQISGGPPTPLIPEINKTPPSG